MLVVSRKVGDSIFIELGDGEKPIEIRVLDNGNQVKLGIIAPQTCKLWRNEIYQTVVENRQAAASDMAHIHDVLQALPKDGKKTK